MSRFEEEWASKRGFSARTSGSTGVPQKIILPHAQVERSALRTNRFFNVDSSSCLYSAVSFEFIGGKMTLARAFMANCEYGWQEPSLQPFPPLQDRVSLMSVVPAQLPSILSRKEEFSHVEAFLVGGSPVSEELWRQTAASGIQAFESYGMTETASHIALREIKGSKPGDVPFYPLPGIQLSVNDERCVVIRDEDIVVSTHDVVRFLPDGGFFIEGRIDNIINSGGKKVMPQAIEQELNTHVDFKGHSFYIDTLPHPQWNQEIVLVVEGDETSLPTLYTLKNDISSLPETVIPRWQRPKRILLADRLPFTVNGKLRRGDTVFLRSLLEL